MIFEQLVRDWWFRQLPEAEQRALNDDCPLVLCVLGRFWADSLQIKSRNWWKVHIGVLSSILIEKISYIYGRIGEYIMPHIVFVVSHSFKDRFSQNQVPGCVYTVYLSLNPIFIWRIAVKIRWNNANTVSFHPFTLFTSGFLGWGASKQDYPRHTSIYIFFIWA